MSRSGLLIVLALSACAAGDPPVPWDTGEMTRELMIDLRRFEHITSDPREVEVLAWGTTVQVKGHATPPGLPPVARTGRLDAALLWGRFETKAGTSEWLVIQASRGDEGWVRQFINTEYMSPPRRLRPGERPDGTWPGFNRYTKPPTSKEVCDFASVSYLAVSPPIATPKNPRGDWSVEKRAGAVRAHTWRRVTGDEPACGGWER